MSFNSLLWANFLPSTPLPSNPHFLGLLAFSLILFQFQNIKTARWQITWRNFSDNFYPLIRVMGPNEKSASQSDFQTKKKKKRSNVFPGGKIVQPKRNCQNASRAIVLKTLEGCFVVMETEGLQDGWRPSWDNMWKLTKNEHYAKNTSEFVFPGFFSKLDKRPKISSRKEITHEAD